MGIEKQNFIPNSLNQTCLRKTIFVTLKIPKPQSGTIKLVVIKSLEKMNDSNEKNPTH